MLEQTVNDLQALLEAADAVVEGVAEGAVLELVPASAEAKYEAPDADPGHRLGHLGEQGRVAVGVAQHEVAQLAPLPHGCYPGQHSPGFPDTDQIIRLRTPHHQVIGHPQAI